MRKFTQLLEPRAEKPGKLTRNDWLVVGAVFVISAIVAFWGLQYADLPMGLPAVVGLSPLCAVAAALFCAYVWQFESFGKANIRIQLVLLSAYIIVALGAIALGFHAGEQGIISFLTKGMSRDAHIGVSLPWLWILGAAIGAFYVQVWTLVRFLLLFRHPHK